MQDAFVATEPWNPKRPQVLVVCCSDGRFHAPIVEFIGREVCDRADLVALPGGPAVIDPWNSSFDEARVFDSTLHLFLAAHDLRQTCLIAHQGCAYYLQKHPGLSPEAMEARQKLDLRRAAEILREKAAHLVPSLRFARIVDGRVRFEIVDLESSNEAMSLS
jgi:hypothetical protein